MAYPRGGAKGGEREARKNGREGPKQRKRLGGGVGGDGDGYGYG